MRTTISLDDNVAALAEKIAEREKRNFSNLCEVALAEYCKPRAEDGQHADLIAAAEEVGIEQAVATLKEMKRPKHRRHAA